MGDHIENCAIRHKTAEDESEDPEHARRPPGPLGDTDDGDHQADEPQSTFEKYREKPAWRNSDRDAEDDGQHQSDRPRGNAAALLGQVLFAHGRQFPMA